MTRIAAGPALPPGGGVNDCWNRIGVRGDRSCPELQRVVHCHHCPVFGQAAAILAGGDLPERDLADATRRIAQRRRAAAAPAQSAVVFRVAGEWLALPTAIFQEVLAARPIHRLPHRRSPAVLGVASVRGELRVCVSLAQLLRLGPPAAAPARSGPPRLIALRREAGNVALPADEVAGVHRFRDEDLRERPATLARAGDSCTRGLLAWRDVSVGLLDPGRLLEAIERTLA